MHLCTAVQAYLDQLETSKCPTDIWQAEVIIIAELTSDPWVRWQQYWSGVCFVKSWFSKEYTSVLERWLSRDPQIKSSIIKQAKKVIANIGMRLRWSCPMCKLAADALMAWKKASSFAVLLKLPPSVCSCQALHQAWAAQHSNGSSASQAYTKGVTWRGVQIKDTLMAADAPGQQQLLSIRHHLLQHPCCISRESADYWNVDADMLCLDLLCIQVCMNRKGKCNQGTNELIKSNKADLCLLK